MRQEVGNAKYRIAFVVAHVHVYHGAVSFGHHAMQGQRQRYPLVVLDAAIVMRVEEGKAVALVHGVLLQVETGAVDVGAQDVQALLQRLGADVRKDERLAVHASPHLIARLELAAFAHRFLKRLVSCSFSLGHRSGKATALGLVVRDEVDIAGSQRIQLFKLLLAVRFPCVLAFQENHLSRKLVYRKKA